MDQPKPIFQWQSGSSHPVTAGEVTVTPQAQALIVRKPHAGLVWNRPSAILVEQSGQTQRIPIYDLTRILQLSLFVISAACWIGILLFQSRRRDDQTTRLLD
jgi:hypothetical protein